MLFVFNLQRDIQIYLIKVYIDKQIMALLVGSYFAEKAEIKEACIKYCTPQCTPK